MMNINKIVQTQKCISCGACESRCPAGAIKLEYYHKIGFYKPKIESNKCIKCGICLKVCPAENNAETNTLVGTYCNILLAHTTNYLVRHNATSGGVISALVKYLLDKDIVECVLMVGYSSQSPIEAEGIAITQKNAECLSNRTRDFSSRYVTVPLLKDIKMVAKQYKRIAVVGTPCQIRAVNLLQQNSVIKCEKLIKIGIACSGGNSYLATQEYKRRYKMFDAKMFYRGDGWPGKNCIESDGKKVEYAHLGSLYERMFSSQIFKNPGCRHCNDQFAEEADVSFCDFWNGEEIKTEKEGNSCTIIRSHFLNDIISLMITDNKIEVVRQLNENEVVDTQKFVLSHKKSHLNITRSYKLFMRCVDFIFHARLYRLFNLKAYRRMCRMYSSICRRGGAFIRK